MAKMNPQDFQAARKARWAAQQAADKAAAANADKAPKTASQKRMAAQTARWAAKPSKNAW